MSRRTIGLLSCLAGALAGVVLIVIGGSRPSLPSLPAPAATAVAGPSTSPATYVGKRVVPKRLIVPAMGISAPVEAVGLTSSGEVSVPPLTSPNLAGWYRGSVTPGQPGPAVLVGHVDSSSIGPMVFWKLRELRPGDRIITEPGPVTFVVTRITQVAKAAFPTAAVYGPTPDAELRLVTCGGQFDPATGHYLSNVIVFARLV